VRSSLLIKSKGIHINTRDYPHRHKRYACEFNVLNSPCEEEQSTKDGMILSFEYFKTNKRIFEWIIFHPNLGGYYK
jgi:hypothetical protein